MKVRWLWLALIVIGSACNNDNSGTNKPIFFRDVEGTGLGGFLDRLQECGILTAGDVSTEFFDTGGDASCFIQCATSVPCDDLFAAFCGQFTGGPNLFNACDEQCAFACTDGRDVSEFDVCDGFDDCEDGIDEVGCPTFTCADGEVLPADDQCDGDVDCFEGDDEDGCPSFSCDNGEIVPLDFRCDFYPDCEDGSDEEDCAQVTCQAF